MQHLENCIVPTVRISWKIQCLLYAGFLAALSSSRSLILCLSVCPSVRPSVRLSVRPSVKKWSLEYQTVIKTYLPTYLWDGSDSSDSRDIYESSDSSDSRDQKTCVSEWVSERVTEKKHENSPHKKTMQPLIFFLHQIGPPGRFGIVVAMSVSLLSPFYPIFEGLSLALRLWQDQPDSSPLAGSTRQQPLGRINKAADCWQDQQGSRLWRWRWRWRRR